MEAGEGKDGVVNKIWICLIALHGCFNQTARVEAYKTETECNQAIKKARSNGAIGRCATVDYIIEETERDSSGVKP